MEDTPQLLVLGRDEQGGEAEQHHQDRRQRDEADT